MFYRRIWPLILWLALFTAQQVSAYELHTLYHLQIPSNQANIALKSLARQTKHSLLFQTSEVSNITTNTVNGYFTLEQALIALLKETQLSAKITKKEVVTISLLPISVIKLTDKVIENPNVKIKPNRTREKFIEDKAKAIEVITVTATRRRTSLQKTAITMEVFAGEQLDMKGYRNIGQFIDTVPGITASAEGPGRNRVIFRNISTSTQDVGNPVIASYFDDFALTSGSGAADIRLVDMERVEILKGPQGTLYGRSAMGGIIRYISNKPRTDVIEGGISLYSSQVADGGNNVGIDGYLNLPLMDDLAVRLVAYNYQNSGFIDNDELAIADFNEESTSGGRVALHWQASDLLTLDLTYFNQKIDSAPNWVTTTYDAGDLSVAGDEGPNIAVDINARNQVAGIIMNEKFNLSLSNIKINYDFEYFSTLILATRSHLSNDFVFDQRQFVDLRSGCACDQLASNDAQPEYINDIIELRLVSSANDGFDWILGVYYENGTNKLNRRLTYYGPEQFVLGVLPLFDGEVLGTESTEQYNKENALYGELGFDLSLNTHLTVGARHSQVNYGSLTTQADGLIYVVNGTKALVGIEFATQDSVNTYKFALEHKFDDDIFAFASASSGYRRGGFNLPTISSSFSTYDSDSLWNYEMGIKSSWFDDTLIANASVYLINYDDIQLAIQDPDTFVSATLNVGQAQISGIEISLNYQINDYVDVSVSGALSDPKLKADVPGGNSGVKGDRLPGSAKANFAVSANWYQPMSANWSAFANTTYKYVGSRYNDFNPDLDVKLASYQLTDFRLGLTNETENYTVAFFVDNLFDESVIYLIDHQGPNFDSVPTNRPRTLGINLSYSF